MRHRNLLVCSALAVSALFGSPASAQKVDDATRASARQLGNSGVTAYQDGDYATAHTKLDKAYKILRAPSLGLWSARAMTKLGKLVEAAERYVEVTRLPASSGDEEVQRQAKTDAQTELDALSPRIPNIVIQLEGADPASVSMTVDDVAISSELVGENRPVNPGKHRVVAKRGAEQVVSEVSVKEGEQKPALLRFSAATSGAPATPGGPTAAPTEPGASAPAEVSTDKAPGSSRKTLAWVAIGAGGVGLAVGAATGVLAMGKKSEIDDSRNCDDTGCLASERDLVDSYDSMRMFSTVGFIAGGALAATGVVLLLTAPKEEPTNSAVALRLGLGQASLSGRF